MTKTPVETGVFRKLISYREYLQKYQHNIIRTPVNNYQIVTSWQNSSRDLFFLAMPDHFGFHEKNDFFCNIFSLVTYTLQPPDDG